MSYYALVAENRWMRIINKILITFRTVKNPFVAVRDYLKLSQGPAIILNLYSGLKVRLRSNTVDSHEAVTILSGQEYPFRLLQPALGQGALVLDIGAHLGSFSLYLKAKRPDLKIYCFEPAEDNFQLLSENVSLNSLSGFKLFPIAIAGKAGTVFLNTASLDSNAYALSQTGQPVPSLDLDSLIEQEKISRIDLIKMDCEGAEYDILANFKKINLVKALMLEYHRKSEKLDDGYIVDLMQKNNFILQDRRDRSDHSQGLLYFKQENK
jgi:FkbM family methyltransferase